MNTLATETISVRAQSVALTDTSLIVDLTDGRTISVPLAWYPRLIHASPAERAKWIFNGDREGIHWPDIDEDISVQNLIMGKSSGESQRSFKRWLESRKAEKRES